MKNFKEVWQIVALADYDSFQTSVVGEPEPESYVPQVVRTFDNEKEALDFIKGVKVSDLELEYQYFINTLEISIVYKLIPIETPKYDTLTLKQVKQFRSDLKDNLYRLRNKHLSDLNSKNAVIQKSKGNLNDPRIETFQKRIDRTITHIENTFYMIEALKSYKASDFVNPYTINMDNVKDNLFNEITTQLIAKCQSEDEAKDTVKTWKSAPFMNFYEVYQNLIKK